MPSVTPDYSVKAGGGTNTRNTESDQKSDSTSLKKLNFCTTSAGEGSTSKEVELFTDIHS